ncbi:MAG: DUF1232 domain-containing protein [Candidatus Moraniibacteriota bacterium]|jgi:hypothetical protein
MKSVFVVITGIVAFIYLLNPTFGVFELLPDAMPVIGNLDEAGATALLLASLAYFGIDFAHFFNREVDKKDKSKEKIKDVDFEEVK